MNRKQLNMTRARSERERESVMQKRWKISNGFTFNFPRHDVSIDNKSSKDFSRKKGEEKSFSCKHIRWKFLSFRLRGCFWWNIFVIWLIVSVWSLMKCLWLCLPVRKNALKEFLWGWPVEIGSWKNHFRYVKLIFLGQVFWGKVQRDKFHSFSCFVKYFLSFTTFCLFSRDNGEWRSFIFFSLSYELPTEKLMNDKSSSKREENVLTRKRERKSVQKH